MAGGVRVWSVEWKPLIAYCTRHFQFLGSLFGDYQENKNKKKESDRAVGFMGHLVYLKSEIPPPP